jgi:hypothetical protein
VGYILAVFDCQHCDYRFDFLAVQGCAINMGSDNISKLLLETIDSRGEPATISFIRIS